jgi:magnesium transporter
MAEGEVLGRAFAADHPGEAADVLEGVPAAAVAAFLAELPAADAAAVLAAMLPGPAAGVVAAMAPEAGAAALRNVPPERAAALLRCLDRDRREALVTALRPGRRAAVKLLLAYPADTVGAWADPRVLAVRRDASVGHARRAVADSGTPAACDLYVVAGDRHLVGTVPVGKLLRLDPEEPVARVMDAEVAALPASLGVMEARGAPDWTGHGSLPVVDARGRLLGAVSAATLERAAGVPGAPEATPGPAAAGELVTTYLQAVVGLLRGFWAMAMPSGQSRRGRP